MDLLKFLKMLLGAIVSILIARYFKLDHEFSAGLLTLLSITDTKKSTLKLAGQRMLSLFIGIFLASGIFFVFGYSLISFFYVLAIYIPLSMLLGLMVGLVPSCVLIGQILSGGDISASIILNEIFIMAVAVFVGGILNLYMPSNKQKIIQTKLLIEEEIKKIYYIFYLRLTPADFRNIIKEKIPSEKLTDLLEELNANISLLNNLVTREEENTLFSSKEYDKKYVILRRTQYNILSYMNESLNLLKIDREQGKMLASLFYLTAEHVSETNSCDYLLNDLEMLLAEFKKHDLPKSREEFEDRAILFRLLNDFKRFLTIKHKFIEELKIVS